MKPLIFLFSLVILLTLIFLILGYIVFIRTCGRKKGMGETVKAEKYKPFDGVMRDSLVFFESLVREEITLTSFDGLKLHAEIILPDRAPRGVFLAYHGYHSSARADFSPIASALLGKGYALILPDQRSHRKSEGKYVTLGVLEGRDCRLFCDFAAKRFENIPIFLYGVSMGGATVLTACGNDLPKTVAGVIADCPFTSAIDIIRHNLVRKYKIPPFPTVYFTDLWARLLGGFSFFGDSPLRGIKNTSLPILLIHGGADRYVPTEMSAVLCDTARSKGKGCKLVIFDGVRHARSYLTDPKSYLSEIFEFIKA
ncbi:MAG: alpha/beta hydrolase [Ruminococcaceae bacterium]|nr:alpha/beta hydrolase [Oscillospiraceae bacterium]